MPRVIRRAPRTAARRVFAAFRLSFFRKFFRTIFGAACVAFLAASCISQRDIEYNPTHQTYATFDLFFSFTYPVSWSVFEDEAAVRFSNDSALLTAPAGERRFASKMFLGSVQLSDAAAPRTIYASLQKYAAFLRRSRGSVFAPDAKSRGGEQPVESVPFSDMQPLADIMEREEFAAVRALVQTVSGWQFSARARAYQFAETAVIADIAPPAGTDRFNPRDALAVRALIVRPVQENVFAVVAVNYNSGVRAGDAAQFSSLIDAEDALHGQLFSQLISAARSVQTVDPNAAPPAENQ